MTKRRVQWSWPLLGALTVAYAAFLGSLYFSEIRHFTPCLLCWYQRILMYPLVPLLAFALASQTPRLAYLVLVMAVAGQGVSTYHYLIQKTTWLTSATVCGTTGVSCGLTYIDWYGVITIPMLAMLAFMLISLCMVLYLNGVGGSDGPVPLALNMRATGAVALLLVTGLVVWLVLRTTASVEAAVPESIPTVSTMPTLAEPAAEAGSQLAGQRLFGENCAVCHGPDGAGIPTLTPSLQTSAAVQGFTPAELAALIRKGITPDDPLNQLGGTMPPFGNAMLTDSELQAIVAYLKVGIR